MTDMAFVRSEIAPARPAPVRTSGFVVWARKNLFASVGDSILTVLAVAFLLFMTEVIPLEATAILVPVKSVIVAGF